ncbi:MAG: tRNA (N(6)-L-threonylcarbamoyladenosine(37)-C(2))-methylthiotransferase MtaB, partial [Deltaproteobacteria bacterium]
MQVRTFKIFTLGCKVNQWESAYFRTALEAAGWKEAGENDPYDVAIVNTCIVTQKASHQSRQAIRRFIRENPGAVVVAAGCYAQVYPEELGAIEGLSLIVGNTLKPALPELLIKGVSGN